MYTNIKKEKKVLEERLTFKTENKLEHKSFG